MSQKIEIQNQTFDAERALYHLQHAEVRGCTFAGEADGESAMKEAADLAVSDCRFALRYPFWHTRRFTLTDSVMEETCRAPLWYAEDGRVEGCEIRGVKCLRECNRMTLCRTTAVSPEFGWNCRTLRMEDCDVDSMYFLMGSRDAEITRLHLTGKYTFQYTENVTVTDSVLETKDAFWHAKNVTVKNCTVRGEYLGWYAENLTFENCTLIGTQPLCYCKGLRLVNCTMEEADLAFEYSEVEADLRGTVLSVKNPKSGHITADGFGEIITEGAVMPCDCKLVVRT